MVAILANGIVWPDESVVWAGCDTLACNFIHEERTRAHLNAGVVRAQLEGWRRARIGTGTVGHDVCKVSGLAVGDAGLLQRVAEVGVGTDVHALVVIEELRLEAGVDDDTAAHSVVGLVPAGALRHAFESGDVLQ